jgi:hypothetical protein
MLLLAHRAEARDAVPATAKAYLHVVARELELAWNADQGEEGRGNGEIFLFTMVTWGGAVERMDPQKETHGPLGGANEVGSGAVYQDPPNSGKYKIRPAVVTEGLKKMYHNYADCPVPTSIRVHARLWEDDNNTDVKFYSQLIAEGINALVEGSAAGTPIPSFAEFVTNGLVDLIDWLTYSEDDELGRFTGTVSFPDPCAGFFEKFEWVPLENRAAALWESVNAEDSTGTPFSSYGITPPANIGRLRLQLWGGTLGADYASALTPPYQLTPPDTNGHWRITRVDLGQPSECMLSAALDLQSALPPTNPHVTYSLFLDTDHEIATGSPVADSHGAEFELRLPLAETSAGVAPLLFRYDSGSGQFQLVAGAVIGGEVDLDGGAVFLRTELASIDNPTDSVAAWAISRSVHGDFLAPPDAEMASPVITVQETPSAVPPTVTTVYPSPGARDVPVADSIVVEFSKHMDRTSVPPAFAIEPPVGGTFAWEWDRATFHPTLPLLPGTLYRVRVGAATMDCLGAALDGDGDHVQGDGYEWWFATRPAPLTASTQDGNEKDRFAVADHVYATGSAFPPFGQADLYVIQDDSLRVLPAWPLLDVTPGGAELASFTATGELKAVNLGLVPVEGEYHIVADLNRNGLFEPGIDRIDRTGIGFAVLGSAVDGVRDAGCSAYAAVQLTQTGAGNSTWGLPGFADGSELNAACVTYEPDALRLFVAGNLKSDFSKLEIFFDCIPGGQGRLRNDNANVDLGGLNRMGGVGPGDGIRFDLGFEADYWIGVSGGNPGDGAYHLFANYATLPAGGGGIGAYLGETTASGDGQLIGGDDPLGIRAAIHNGNVAGAVAGCGPGGAPADPRGVELRIPYAALGNPTGCIRISMFVNSPAHDFVSNQFLGSVPPGTCSLGEPRVLDLVLVPGPQFFTACLPAIGADDPIAAPIAFAVRARPNPSSGEVRFRWSGAPRASLLATVYDVTGRRLRTLRAPGEPAGELVWDGRSELGAPLPAGLYLVQFSAGGVKRNLRVVLLR